MLLNTALKRNLLLLKMHKLQTRSSWAPSGPTYSPMIVSSSRRRGGNASRDHVFSVATQVGLALPLAGYVFVTDFSPSQED